MSKKMLIDAAHPEEVRVALLDQGKVEDFDFESEARKPLRGNIYLARVTRVEPSLQAAFVEYGGNRHGFLAFSEIHPDYYQIPVSDREQLQAAEAEVAELAAQLELVQRGDEEDDESRYENDDDNQPDAADYEDGEDAENGEPVLEASADDEAETEEAEAPSEEDKPEEAEASDDEDQDEDEEEDVKDEEGGEEESSEEETVEADAEETDDAEAAAEEESDQPYILEEEPLADIEEPLDGEEVENEAAETTSDEDAPEEDDKKKARRKKREAREALFERYKDAKRKRSRLLRNYKIQEVIKRRQILLVQVVKEERGNKGAALTTYMSLAGRYCVLMPNTARGGGISRKIANASDRRRLRRVVDSLEVPQGMGLIIRTAGAKRTKTEIKRDYDYLLRLWENIRTLTLKSIAPCLIYEEASLIKRAIRDLYDKDISNVLVEGEAGYREAKDFMKMLMPSHAKNVQPYKDRAPIFLKHNVESQLDGMYQPSVRLKSGGYIVIHQTEALVAIDVNSGRATRERNIELTALKTNIEAAQEAARQFRLRDLAGLIVLDFIDMEEPKNNRKVEKALKEALKTDRARIQVGRISSFGLLEMSRQRRRSGIVDGTTNTCPACSGAGVVRSHEMAALRILRAIEGEAISGKVGRITARTSLDVSLYILNHNREWLERIEHANGVKIEILADPDKIGDAFELEKSGTPRERVSDAAFVRPDQTEPVDIDTEEEKDGDDAGEAREGGRKRRRRRRRRKDASDAERNEEATSEEETEEATEKAARSGDDSSEEEAPKRRRRRGRRGGRRNRRNNGEEREATSTEEAPSEEQSASADADETAPSAADSEGEVDAPSAEETAPPHANGADEEPSAKAAPEPGPELEPEAEAIAEPEPEPEVEPEADVAPEPKKPARKGWWQRATG